MTDNEIQKILEPVQTQIDPLMGGPVVIITKTPTCQRLICIHSHRTTLTTDVLTRKLKELSLHDTRNQGLNVIVGTSDEDIPVITISLINENSGRT